QSPRAARRHAANEAGTTRIQQPLRKSPRSSARRSARPNGGSRWAIPKCRASAGGNLATGNRELQLAGVALGATPRCRETARSMLNFLLPEAGGGSLSLPDCIALGVVAGGIVLGAADVL